MRPHRILVGTFLFTASIWLVPMIPEMLTDVDSFLVGLASSMVAFLSGMVIYSGVRTCPRW